jgi:membrane-associated phospholipid phosphatase
MQKNIGFLVLWACALSAFAQTDSFKVSPLTNLGRNISRSFIGWNSLLHLGSAGATAGLIESGADARMQKYFNCHPDLSALFFPAAMTGGLVPIGTSMGLYARGRISRKREILGAGCALIQANSLSFIKVSLLKSVTGRPYPDYWRCEDMDSLSRVFRWGFIRGGIFWGWPSGHADATMTTIACLTNYYPEKLWLRIGGYALAAYTMVGVAAVKNGNMHWFSDGVAGAMMGYAVGSTVGRSFRNLLQSKKAESRSGLRIIPVVFGDYSGVAMQYRP